MSKWETIENFLTIDDSIPVVRGVERFISDFPTGRMLILCGEKGTGKSHLVASILDNLRSKGKISVITPGMEMNNNYADLIVVENVNFYSPEALENLRELIVSGSATAYVVTCRGKCEDRSLRKVVKSYNGEKEFFYLPTPPYELKKGILRRYIEFSEVPLMESTLDFLLENLPWPKPLRIVDLLKTRGILRNIEVTDKDLISLIREFQNGWK